MTEWPLLSPQDPSLAPHLSLRPLPARQKICQRAEAAPVLFGWAIFAQSTGVYRCAIALMLLEAIARRAAAKLGHQPIAGHFGDDRGGGDRNAARIALD